MRVVFVLLVVNDTIDFDKCSGRGSFAIDILSMAPSLGNRVPISKFPHTPGAKQPRCWTCNGENYKTIAHSYKLCDGFGAGDCPVEKSKNECEEQQRYAERS
jgi:hypothetical protein